MMMMMMMMMIIIIIMELVLCAHRTKPITKTRGTHTMRQSAEKKYELYSRVQAVRGRRAVRKKGKYTSGRDEVAQSQ
jgi:hypothetical protein